MDCVDWPTHTHTLPLEKKKLPLPTTISRQNQSYFLSLRDFWPTISIVFGPLIVFDYNGVDLDIKRRKWNKGGGGERPANWLLLKSVS